jgi:small subunit ribosomal protein S16
MALKIRLTRIGSRHRPFFRLAVVDSRARRDGRSVSVLGYYNPLSQPHQLKVHQDEVIEWLKKGAQPTETARSLLKQTGVWQRYQLMKEGKSPEVIEQEVAESLERIRVKAEKAAAAKAAKAEKAAAPVAEAPTGGDGSEVSAAS